MGTAARKARKRAGVRWSNPAKVGTPVEDRAVRSPQEHDAWRRRWGLKIRTRVAEGE